LKSQLSRDPVKKSQQYGVSKYGNGFVSVIKDMFSLRGKVVEFRAMVGVNYKILNAVN
jgi:hypothetical protein